MNEQETIKFILENSSEPVIKNSILQAALREPRPMAQGGRLGFQSGQLVDHGPGRQGYAGDRQSSATKRTTHYKKLLENLPEGYFDEYVENFYTVNKETGKLSHLPGGPGGKGIPYMEKKYGDIIKETYKTRQGETKNLNRKIRNINAAIKLSIKDQIESGLKASRQVRKEDLKIVGDLRVKAPPGKVTHHMMPLAGVEGDSLNLASTKNTAFISNELNSKMAPYDTKLKANQKEQIKLLKDKPDGWEKKINELNFKAKNIYKEASKKIPGSNGYLGYSQIEVNPGGTYDIKVTGIDPNKSLAGLEGEEIFYKNISPEDRLKVNKMSNIKSNKIIPTTIKGMVGKGIGKAFNLGLGPTGMAGLTYALKPEDGYDLSKAEDRIGFEAEAVLAPTLVKGVASVTDKIKNPLLRKGLETLAGVRIPGIMNPTNALRIARIASPIGLASLAVEGMYHSGKKEMAKRKQMSPEELDAYMLEKQSRGWSKMSEGAYNQGGRVGLAKGSKGPKDPSKRLFIKGVAAASMIPILGKYFKLAKPAAKAVGQYTGPVIEKIKGLEWVQFLAKRLWNEGDDVTKTAATMDGQIVRRGTLESGDEVDMIYDTRSGDVSFEVMGPKSVKEGLDKFQTKAGAYSDPYSVEYKAPQIIEETGKKTRPTIEVSEARPRQVAESEIELDGDIFDVDDALSDLTELEAFAKKKFTKEIHKTKGTKPKKTSPDFEGPEPDLDDYASGGRVSYFDGGIVGLKKKW